MGMKIYSALTNIAAGLATASVIIDSHKMGKNMANASLINGAGKDLLEDTIGASKINYPSEKYAKAKNDILKFKMGLGYKDAIHKTKGYVKGFGEGILCNLPTVLFSLLTFISKKRAFKTIGVIGVGLSVAWNFIKNGTNILEKNDYLKY